MRPHLQAVASALWAAALSTLGDWIWARFITSHRTAFGLVHGVVLFLAIGGALGLPRGRPVRGALTGAAIGLGAAVGFYALAPVMGYSAMFVAWMALWIGLAWMVARGLGEPLLPAASVWFRGSMAALGSGLAFYAISGIWTNPRPGGPDYGYHLVCWTIAFLPGFAALLVRAPAER